MSSTVHVESSCQMLRFLYTETRRRTCERLPFTVFCEWFTFCIYDFCGTHLQTTNLLPQIIMIMTVIYDGPHNSLCAFEANGEASSQTHTTNCLLTFCAIKIIVVARYSTSISIIRSIHRQTSNYTAKWSNIPKWYCVRSDTAHTHPAIPHYTWLRMGKSLSLDALPVEKVNFFCFVIEVECVKL